MSLIDELNEHECSNGFTALEFAVKNKKCTVVASLLASGATISSNVRQALIDTVYSSSGEELIQLFISHGLKFSEDEMGKIRKIITSNIERRMANNTKKHFYDNSYENFWTTIEIFLGTLEEQYQNHKAAMDCYLSAGKISCVGYVKAAILIMKHPEEFTPQPSSTFFSAIFKPATPYDVCKKYLNEVLELKNKAASPRLLIEGIAMLNDAIAEVDDKQFHALAMSFMHKVIKKLGDQTSLTAEQKNVLAKLDYCKPVAKP